VKDKTLVLIPARGGSKGIPGKNLQRLGKATLLEWAVKVGQSWGGAMGVSVSTDYEDIAQAALSAGATVLRRPPELSQDNSTVVDMVHYHLKTLEEDGRFPEVIVYLEPTSPFRTVQEINECMEALLKNNYDSVATFTALNYHPSWLLTCDETGRAEYMEKDQPVWSITSDTPHTYAITGGVYVFRTRAFLEAKPLGILFGDKGHIIQKSPPIDIDTIFELETARTLLEYIDTSELAALGLV